MGVSVRQFVKLATQILYHRLHFGGNVVDSENVYLHITPIDITYIVQDSHTDTIKLHWHGIDHQDFLLVICHQSIFFNRSQRYL